MINDIDLKTVRFLTFLRILEMVNQGVTDITLIAEKAEVSIETVKKVVPLIVTDKQ